MMTKGLVLMKWSPKSGYEVLTIFPDDLKISERTLMQIYSAHEYTGELGIIAIRVGPLNIVSYYTGREKPLYIILLLNLDEDPDLYEGGLADISRVILENYEDYGYPHIVPSLFHYLFQRLSLYPHMNEEQILAFSYLDTVNNLIINRLREERILPKSEINIWLKDVYRKAFFDVDAILKELIKKEIVSVGGKPLEKVSLINDIFMTRQSPKTLIKKNTKYEFSSENLQEYDIVENFFQTYQPSEDDNLKILKQVTTDPDAYEILKILRTSIVTRNDLEKLGVYDIDDGLSKLWRNKILHVIEDIKGIEYYVLQSDFIVKKSPVMFNIFISYSTKDTDYFNIPKIAEKLEEYSEIENALYWTKERGMNNFEYMENVLNTSKVFVPFCSKNASKSKAVKNEWMAAFELKQLDRLKIVPVYEKQKYLPSLLRPFLNVAFDSRNFEKFIQNLYKEIMRDIESL
ncbi:hypothetical protein LCGC14_2283470 [marine sediment metagenome]|uniref:TIR domain-containing protein n=1 Tax=marine sediment metagenome TaxID=412755 RepID=A0A0F9FNL5_9ZZZZ